MRILYQILAYLKAIAALVGSVATAFIAAGDADPIWITISVVATAVATYALPKLDPDQFGATRAEMDTDYDDDDPLHPEPTDDDVDDLPVESFHGGVGESEPESAFDSGEDIYPHDEPRRNPLDRRPVLGCDTGGNSSQNL